MRRPPPGAPERENAERLQLRQRLRESTRGPPASAQLLRDIGDGPASIDEDKTK